MSCFDACFKAGEVGTEGWGWVSPSDYFAPFSATCRIRQVWLLLSGFGDAVSMYRQVCKITNSV